MQKRIPVRDLEPMATGEGEEIRMAIVQVGGTRRLTMTSWSKGLNVWYECGPIEIPLDVLSVLSARLRAAVTQSRDDVAA